MTIRAAALEGFGEPLGGSGARPRRAKGRRGAHTAHGLRVWHTDPLHGVRCRPFRVLADGARARARGGRRGPWGRASPRLLRATMSWRSSCRRTATSEYSCP